MATESLLWLPTALVIAGIAHLAQTRTDAVLAAPGVTVLIHPRATDNFPNGNTVVVAGEDGLLVFDTAYFPSVARQDIEWIRSHYRQPVRYVVNSHWHYDHVNGNAEYRQAFPEATIIAHADTKRLIELNSARYARSVVAPESGPRKVLATLRSRLGDTTLTPLERDTVRARVTAREREQAEMAALTVVAPDQTFRDSLTLRLGTRTIALLHRSRGNTPGDVIAWLPKERVVATGDLLVHPIPYAYNSIPHEWVGFLSAIDSLAPAVIIPGHGPVFRNREYLRTVKTLIEEVTNHVGAAWAAGRTADQARASFDFAPWRNRLAGQDDFLRRVFDGSIVQALVDRAYLSAQGAL